MNTSIQRRHRAAAAGTLTAVASAILVLGTPTLAQAQAAAADSTQTVTVTGIRRGIENAINLKKNSDNIVEAVSAEDLGKLPDISIAESIARLPGVATQRVGGRAQAISIRGFGPDFSTTLLNGREQATTSDSRSAELDQYPSELFNSAVIYKTADGSLVGQGLSGTLDMRTARPLDFGQRAAAVNYRKQKSGVGLDQEGDGSRFSLSYIDQFANRTVGVALGFARLSETGPTTAKFESWGGGQAAFGEGNVNVPYNGFNAWSDQKTQKRDGAMAVLQWKPSKAFETSLDLFYSKFEQISSRKGFQAPMNDSWNPPSHAYDPGGILTAATLSGNDVTAGTFNNVRAVVRNDSEQTNDKLSSIGWNSKLNFGGGWTASADLATSKSERVGVNVETTAGTAQAAANTAQLDSVQFTSAGSFTPGLNYGDRSIIKLTDVQGWGGGPATVQAGYTKQPHVTDKLDTLRLGGKRELSDLWGLFSAVDFGFNMADRKKTREFVEAQLRIKGGLPFATAEIPGSSTTTAGLTGISIATFDPVANLDSIYELATKTHPDIFNKDWTVNEKVNTFFGKMDIDGKLGGLALRGNVGLQFVHTDQSSTAYSVDRTGNNDAAAVGLSYTAGTSYNDILPSLNLVADLGGDQVVRFGLARQMARSTLNDMRASGAFGLDSTKGIYSGSGGNPYLKPFRANAIDVTYEKYFGTKAYFAAAGFYKDLSTYVISVTRPFDFTPFLTPSTPPAPLGNVGEFTQPVNGSGGRVSGLELSASLPFNLFTPVLDGFGVQANYAYTSSSVALPPSGVTNEGLTGSIPLPGLSKNVGNLTVYFEKYGFSARVAGRHRSDFVGEVTSFAGDRQLTNVKAETVIDAQLSYEFQTGFAKGLSVLFQAYNLSNAEYIRYRGDTYTKANEAERTTYGKTYLLGVNYKL